MSKVIISGIRTCDQKVPVTAEIEKFLSEIGNVKEIVTGGSTGVEKIAKEYAGELNIKNKEILPDWEADLNAAGMIRDSKLAEYGSHLLVLSDGVSKGCNNLIQEAKRNNLIIKVVLLFPSSVAGNQGTVKKHISDRLISST
ncbi:MAG TPA: SLOG family protein [Methanospirillum sp.]|nr:SLOG family protein [Methanospirillum sp.]